MRQRGRKSEANLSVIPTENTRHQLQPPDFLSDIEQELFRDVVMSAPPNQFSLSDVYLLSTFCQITIRRREHLDGSLPRPSRLLSLIG